MKFLRTTCLSRQLLCGRIVFLASLWCTASRFFVEYFLNWHPTRLECSYILSSGCCISFLILKLSCSNFFIYVFLIMRSYFYLKEKLWGRRDYHFPSIFTKPAFGPSGKSFIVVKYLQISLRGGPLPLVWKHFSCLQLEPQIGIFLHSTL